MTSSVGLPRIAAIPRISPRHARQEDTALRHLAVAGHAGAGGARQQAVRHAAVGERRGVLDGVAARGGGPAGHSESSCEGRPGRGAAAGAVLGALARARVRRRRVPGRGRRDLFRQRQGPAGLRHRKGRAAAPDHQCAPHALCRFCPRRGARPPDRRGRGAPRQGRCRPPSATRQPARRHCIGLAGRGHHTGRGPRLLCQSAPLPRRPPARLPRLGPAGHAMGQRHAPRGRRSATAASSAGPSAWRAATAAPSSNRSGAPTAASTSSGTRPVGASSTAGTANASRACTEGAGSSSCGRSGCSARAAMRSAWTGAQG